MSNAYISAPNLTDNLAAITGGSWVASLPASNLKDRRIKRVARSTNAATASTLFVADLGAPSSLGVVAVFGNNLSVDATYRVTMSNSADMSSPVYTSAWIAWWPVAAVPFGSEPWGDFDWSGRPVTAETIGYLPRVLIHLLPSAFKARYVRVEISDASNPAGYVELGRLFLGREWRPVVNMDWGASIGYESRSTAQEAYGGAEYFDKRQAFRVARFTLGHLTSDEAFGQVMRIQAQADTHGDVLYMWDGGDTVYRLQRSFLGRLRSLSPIEHPHVGEHRATFEIKELI